MRRAVIAVVVVVVLVAVAIVSTVGTRGGRFVGFIPFELRAVSADGRSVTVWHEIPHCASEPGRVTVRETSRRVEIRIPEVTVAHFGDYACTADLRSGPSTVRLASPLGTRRLVEPTRNGEDTKTQGILDTRDPERQECDTLIRLSPSAAALDVPWVARRQRYCAAPIPAAAQRLPILRRPRTTADEPPRSQQTTFTEDQVLLRRAEARRLVRGKELWLVPGPQSSCFLRVFPARYGKDREPYYGPCRPSERLGRSGAVVPAACLQSTPTSIDLVGVLPTGIEHVRLKPDRGEARTIAVTGGVWAARVAYPAVIAYGTTRVRTTYEFRSCFG
ncbi:MAG: immunoglobulin domain-containing protein [Solirubrobacteraceae bacterium]|nr:immunoglobulin domain-containing protein [Solirubrobacteraceae bacterium]